MIIANNNMIMSNESRCNYAFRSSVKAPAIVCAYCKEEHAYHSEDLVYKYKYGVRVYTFCSHTCRCRFARTHINVPKICK